MTSLQFGANLNPNSIKEGDDIYFECIVQARPPVTKLQWYHNVSVLSYLLHPYALCRFLVPLLSILEGDQQFESDGTKC